MNRSLFEVAERIGERAPSAHDIEHEARVSAQSASQRFAERVVAWQRVYGRHDLPWQQTRDPYRIWLSEIMLQQTQVAAVIPYYVRFLGRFPQLRALAAADEDEVLSYWSGLGYYARGRNVHRAARLIVERHAGEFPTEFEAVCELPGIGRSTAAAICVFAYGMRHPILDGNVKRVLARHRGVAGYPGDARVLAELWRHAEALLADQDVEAYTQGLMDLGARVCIRRSPDCSRCPVHADCNARANGMTDRLPSPRPRKALPQRRTTFVVLRSGSEVFLEKRPAPGIWGGLWCFPETQTDAFEAVALRFGVQVHRVERLARIAHGFTHFQLDIDPVVLHVSRNSTSACEPSHGWITVCDALSAAVPAPVRRLLETLDESDQLSGGAFNTAG